MGIFKKFFDKLKYTFKRTELDEENLEFRYCSKCNGNYEYCQDHLFTHTHVK